MKKFLMFIFVFSCVFRGYSADLTTGNEILSFVRSKLPGDPLILSGSLKVKAKNGFTKASMPVEMELDWGAATPTASYRIGEPGSKDFQSMDITWNNEKPHYKFSDSFNKPTSDILDTGITWADLSFSVLWWPNAKLVGQEKKINRDCYVVDVPVPGSKNFMQLWIEKNMGMLLEAQTLDAKRNELNRLKIISIKKMDGMWVAKDLELRDKRTGTKTLLEISALQWKNPKPTAEAFDPAESVNDLAMDLYRKLAAGNDGNLFFSPYSISSALAMTYGGAHGETADQMNQVLHFGGPDATHPAFSYLRRMLNGIQEKGYIQLSVANALWPQKDDAFLPDYIRLVKKYYGTEIHPVDYKTDAGGARQRINTWAEDQTNQRIKNLIGEGVLNAQTRLVLANAIYFKGDWASRFKKSATRQTPFTLMNGTKVDVPMMSQTGDFKLAQTDKLQALELPYEGGDLSMIVLLPKPGKQPEPVALNKLEFHKTKINVQLPRFQLKSSFSLGKTLAEMGMPLAFSNQADFSGMDGKKDLSIGEVVHKAYIDVNEEGTEAAAATAVTFGVTSMPLQFIADHPFIFLIRENSTGTILFIGRVTDPR